MEGREKEMKLRVMVMMMAEVDVDMQEHDDGGGAAIRPTIQDNDLIVSYACYDMPEGTPPQAKAPLSTVCAHLMLTMATTRMSRKLNRAAPDEPLTGPTQPMGMA